MKRLVFCIVPLFVACSGKDAEETSTTNSTTGTPGTTTEDTGDTDTLPPPSVQYYYAESVIDVDNGRYVFEETYWVRRELEPEPSTITEEFVAIADGTHTLTLLTVDAALGKFTLTINDGEYTGAGNLYGDPWAWTSWDSISTASDGSAVHSTDMVTSTGIASQKVGFGTDGLQEWTIEEVLTTVTAEEWQAGIDAVVVP